MNPSYTQSKIGPNELGRLLLPHYKPPVGLRARFEPDSKAEFRIMLHSLQKVARPQSGPSELGKMLGIAG